MPENPAGVLACLSVEFVEFFLRRSRWALLKVSLAINLRIESNLILMESEWKVVSLDTREAYVVIRVRLAKKRAGGLTVLKC